MSLLLKFKFEKEAKFRGNGEGMRGRARSQGQEVPSLGVFIKVLFKFYFNITEEEEWEVPDSNVRIELLRY